MQSCVRRVVRDASLLLLRVEKKKKKNNPKTHHKLKPQTKNHTPQKHTDAPGKEHKILK